MIRLRAPFAAASILVAAVFVSGAKPRAAFAPESSPNVRTFPKAVTLGGSGALEVQIEMPVRAGKPVLRTLAGGTVTDPVLEEEIWVARYKAPPGQTSPGYDVILAESKSGSVGATVVQWIARAKLPVTVSRAGASITVKVGGREFGPVQAGAETTIPIQVEIPPGASEVEVTAAVAGQEPLHTVEPLAVPPLERVFTSAPSSAKSGKAFDATIVVLDRHGALSRTPPQITPSAARLELLEESGPGIWKARVNPSGGPLALVIRGEGARGRIALKVPAAKAVETPLPVESFAPVASIPPPPSCTQLQIAPGEITTGRQLRARIEAANATPDLIGRRNGLFAIGCRFPDEHSLQLQLAATNLLLGDNEAAVATVSPLLADESEIHEEHLALGYSYRASAELRLGLLDRAIEDARAAEAQMPGLYSATYTLGEAYFLKRDFPNASAALLSAYRTAPQFASGIDHVMLADLLARRGDTAEALEHRFAATRLEPNDMKSWRATAAAAESAKIWPRAHEAWRMLASSSLPGLSGSTDGNAGAARAKSAAPKDLEIGFLEAAIDANRTRNPVKAVFLLERALKANPRNLATRFELARTLYGAGAVSRATQEIGAVLNEAPHWAPALILAGDIERLKGDNSRAQSRYREALAISPAPALSPIARWRLDEIDKP